MFTKQASAAIARMTGLTEETKQELLGVLGNCTAELEHRGPITLSMDTSLAPAVDAGTISADMFPAAAALNVSNNTSELVDGEVQGGFSVFAKGVSWFENLIFDVRNNVTVHETDVRCVDGIIKYYRRTKTIAIVKGAFALATGAWVWVRNAGCCDCASSVTSESDENSSSYPGDGESSSDSSSSSSSESHSIGSTYCETTFEACETGCGFSLVTGGASGITGTSGLCGCDDMNAGGQFEVVRCFSSNGAIYMLNDDPGNTWPSCDLIPVIFMSVSGDTVTMNAALVYASMFEPLDPDIEDFSDVNTSSIYMAWSRTRSLNCCAQNFIVGNPSGGYAESHLDCGLTDSLFTVIVNCGGSSCSSSSDGSDEEAPCVDCCENCEELTGWEADEDLLLTVSGVTGTVGSGAGGPMVCASGDCGSVHNTTFAVPHLALAKCLFQFIDTLCTVTDGCGALDAEATLQINVDIGQSEANTVVVTWNFAVGCTGGSLVLVFKKSYDGAIPCDNIGNVPFFSASGSTTFYGCDFSGMAVSIA